MKALLFDANWCVGCGACEEACAEKNELPADAEPGLHADRYTTLEEHGDLYLRRMCMHCVEPSCASACPVSALYKTEAGPVAYDYAKCMGCRYCMIACPFSVPRYEWTSLLPRVRKCQMCADRVEQGLPTACSEACPAEATMFGERDEMIALAKQRIAESPDEYSEHIYGLEEAGGTCVLVIGSRELIETAFDPRIPDEALPEKTWVVLSKIPTAVGVAGVGLMGVNWIIRRRMRLMNAEPEVMSGNGRGER
jgi:formate dehydrogenase iron-sulfur subunit